MTRNCSTCKVTKPIEAFHRAREGTRHYECATCKNARKAARSPEAKRAERQAWRARYPEKRGAHRAVAKAVARGKLVRPAVCQRCDAPGDVQAHHEDYERRFDVEWLCVRCHSDAHVSQAA